MKYSAPNIARQTKSGLAGNTASPNHDGNRICGRKVFSRALGFVSRKAAAQRAKARAQCVGRKEGNHARAQPDRHETATKHQRKAAQTHGKAGPNRRQTIPKGSTKASQGSGKPTLNRRQTAPKPPPNTASKAREVPRTPSEGPFRPQGRGGREPPKPPVDLKVLPSSRHGAN